ncbi:hypothetical protein E1301_Tti018677 [Triplophysa tibetana]|uniref:Ig-like domain-containing protein n=1 Tax=Triplophysa tibetana TaxID=1572043 RepID=A0A5A9NTL8_9TELE|nr:hypothetical protein E1301_Tti018677 [Triplophysa tibetana]
MLWFSHKQKKNWRKSDEPEDIALDFDYSGRVKQHITNYHLDLTITDVRERDSGEYQLMFIMKDGVKHISSVTVNLTVTVLQVKIQSTEQRDQKVLSCQASCPLAENPLYVYWIKDGQYIQNVFTKSLSVSSSEYAADYCFSLDSKISSAPVCLSERCWHVTYASRRVCALVGSTVDIHSSYSHPTGYTVVNTFWHSRPAVRSRGTRTDSRAWDRACVSGTGRVLGTGRWLGTGHGLVTERGVLTERGLVIEHGLETECGLVSAVSERGLVTERGLVIERGLETECGLVSAVSERGLVTERGLVIERGLETECGLVSAVSERGLGAECGLVIECGLETECGLVSAVSEHGLMKDWC